MGVVVPLRRDEPADADSASDEALVLAARRGESWAAEALFQRHASLVFGLAHRVLGGPPDDVDDLAQDAFLQAFENLDKLRDPQAFAKWIGSIVVRTAQRRIRRAKLRRRLGLAPSSVIDPDAMVASDAPPDVAAELRALYSIVDSLPVEVRVALVLRRVEGLTLPEIAEQMGLSLATVKRRLQSGEALLSDRLAEKVT